MHRNYSSKRTVRQSFSSLTLLAEDPVWEAEFPCALVPVSSAVWGEDGVPAGGLWPLGPVIPESPSEHVSEEALERPGEGTEKVFQGPEELGIGTAYQQDSHDKEHCENLHFVVCCLWFLKQ